MTILLTNDDGIRAPGLAALHAALVGEPEDSPSPADLRGPAVPPERAGEVITVAPLTVQSATSHGITLHEPLMTRQVRVNERFQGLAVDGRPADCVKLALSSIWPQRFGQGNRPALLVSGINSGANCGVNIIYSGTVAAAIEGAFLGVPSIAFSLHLGRGRPRYDVAARHARRVLGLLLREKLDPHVCLNVNLPIAEEEQPFPPLEVCPMNTHGLVDQYEQRQSPRGDTYYWPTGGGLDFHATEVGSDVDQLFQRCITITPLTFDLTRHGELTALRERLTAR